MPLAEDSLLQVAEVRLVHRADDNLAGLHVDAAYPLAGIDHHAFGDRIDTPAVEVTDTRGTQRRDGPAEAAAQFFQLDVPGHRCQRRVLVGPAQDEALAHARLRPVMQQDAARHWESDEHAD